MFRLSVFLRAAAAPSARTLLHSFGPFHVYRNSDIPGLVEVEHASSNSPMNLMDADFINGLPLAMAYLNEDLNESARVAILLSREGTPFSAGLNLTFAMQVFGPKPPPAGTKPAFKAPAMEAQRTHLIIKKFQECISSVTRCRIPVIAAISGHCLGGAVSLATACDFRFCTADATFSVREVKIGIAPDIGAMQRLPALVGEGRARELCMSARNFGAAEALRYGLVEEVFDSREALLAAARASAKEISENSPLAVQGTKLMMNYQSERPVQESLEHIRLWNTANLLCDDLFAAGAAFAAKKAPKFTNYVVDATCPPVEPVRRSPSSPPK
eukprot:RCo003140